MSSDKQKEFEEIAKKMMKFLCDNHHPHTHVIIDCNTAELSEGVICCATDEFIND